MKKNEDKLTEIVADFMYNQWSNWMKYLYSKLKQAREYPSDHIDVQYCDFLLEREDYNHWKKLMNTPYAEISDSEQDDYREWAVKLLELMEKIV